MKKFNKKDKLLLDNVTSVMNKATLNGEYFFDSYNGEDRCFITKRIGNGMHYLVNISDLQ